jgi:hypothetical protein
MIHPAFPILRLAADVPLWSYFLLGATAALAVLFVVPPSDTQPGSRVRFTISPASHLSVSSLGLDLTAAGATEFRPLRCVEY